MSSFPTVDASLLSGLSGKHTPPYVPPCLRPPMLYLADLCACSQRQLRGRAHAGVAEEALQRVALAVGGGGLRRGLQEGHGSHPPAVLVQPHLLHWVRQQVPPLPPPGWKSVLFGTQDTRKENFAHYLNIIHGDTEQLDTFSFDLNAFFAL